MTSEIPTAKNLEIEPTRGLSSIESSDTTDRDTVGVDGPTSTHYADDVDRDAGNNHEANYVGAMDQPSADPWAPPNHLAGKVSSAALHGRLTERQDVSSTEEDAQASTIPSKPRQMTPQPWMKFRSHVRKLFSLDNRPTLKNDVSPRSPDDSQPTETSALLAGRSPEREARSSGDDVPAEDGLDASDVQDTATWAEEARLLASGSAQLMGTSVLAYSLRNFSVVTVGHLGTIPLGAASLATVTANITGYVIYSGLATSLDTMCPQAFGAGRKELVGLQVQRMTYFLFCVTVPIAVVWLNAGALFKLLIPQADVAALAGTYLKVLLLGAPGFAAFLAGERFLQAQRIFSGSLLALLICSPLAILLNWLFVWKFRWGLFGAPMAVAITDNLMPLCLALYVCFIGGRECWGGFSRRALENWGPMIKLALPGLVMQEAEILAFEILTIAASYFSTSHLAAQTVLSILAATTFQLPLSLSIASSTRIANLVGANLITTAKRSTVLALIAACLVGLLNFILLTGLRNVIPLLFTDDADVRQLVIDTLPWCAAFQLMDAIAVTLGGILRGIGRQSIGSWVNLFCYYAVSIPISLTTAFVFHWELHGFWAGLGIALLLIAAIEGWFVYHTNWEKVIQDARDRNLRDE